MTETQTPSTDSPSKATKTFSCVRCFERKVKCDKEHPCGGCMRSGVECVFRVPPPPRRKKKRTQEDILTERLNQYEQILKQKGIDVQKVAAQNEGAQSDAPSDRKVSHSRSNTVDGSGKAVGSPTPEKERVYESPKLIFDYDGGRSKFLENNLWNRVSEEFNASKDALQQSSDEEDAEDEPSEAGDNIDFVLGLTPSTNSTRSLHPPPAQISAIWRIYVDNVNPFSMIIHRPTLQASIEKAAQDIEHIPKGLEALMFAIYTAAVLSLTDVEVDNTFGESKATLLARYRAATKKALARAKFVGSTEFIVLQAFVLHLLTMRDIYDSRTLWTLTGVALRISEGMGLHRDGTELGLPPFETELRRRVWFQITTLDYRSAELNGTNKFRIAGREHVTTKSPLNINDEDIWPGMKEPPVPHERTTQMTFCCLRYEFSAFWWKKIIEKKGSDTALLWGNYKSTETIAEKDAAIDELERMLEQKYVRYCDPSVPLELATSLVARTAANTMRMIAHHPRRWASEEEVPESERQLVWKLCIKIMESYNMCISYKQLRSFVWHTTFYFQWQAAIYLLDCIRADPLKSGAEEAWQLIGDAIDFNTGLVTDTKKPLHIALGNLVLRAYDAKEEVFKREGRFLPAKPPEYVQKLRKLREDAKAKQALRKNKSHLEAPDFPYSWNKFDTLQAPAPTETPSSQAFAAQRPLPPLQSLSLEQGAQLPEAQAQAQQPSQPAPYWFDNFSNTSSNMAGTDYDWLMMQDPAVDQTDQMDWTQWDSLLDNSGYTKAAWVGLMKQGYGT